MFSVARKRYVLSMLTLVYTLNYLDRGLIVLLLQPIKVDLQLSDSQLGFLTGIAFGLFYATLGLPLARLADRGDRVSLTSLAIGLWGCTVMACVFVTNFVQLVCARVAAAVGESGCMPPTYSLLADYFPAPAERTRAMSIYWLASPISALVSFAMGGWLNELYGWRMTFLIMGVPALLVAVVFRMTVAEPRARAARSQSRASTPSMAEVLAALWQQQSARHLSAAIILLFMLGLGMAPWYAAFMMRSHGMQTAELGVWLGLIFGISGAVGILLGGYINGRRFGIDERVQLRTTAVMCVLLLPCFVLFLLLPEKHQALAALMALGLTFSFYVAPSFALLQRLAPDDMRATTLAVVMLLANLIGMGLGPQIVGILSDAWRPALGEDSLRYAMLAMSVVSLWAAWHFWRAVRTVREDLAAAARSERADACMSAANTAEA